MPLSQDDRISISLKIVQIPKQDEQSDKIQAQLEDAKVQAQKEDDGNRQLMDDITPLVDAYQLELQRYDGNGRTSLVEQDMQDAVNRKLQNFFFPNDTTTPIPSVPDGVWKNFPAFSGSKGVGKNYDETFSTVQKEQDLIDDVNAKIVVVEGFIDATRSSGNECVESGICSNPIYTDETSCTTNGGIWTPGLDIIQPDTAMQAAGTDLENSIQAWEDFMNTTFSAIPTNIQDPNATRSAQNDTSRDDITSAISVIDTWQALQDYDTATSTPTTCAAFNVFPASSFQPSKFRVTELQDIKDEIAARQAFISSRITALLSNTYLGGVTQDLNNGEITAATGFYGNRFRIIDMRLNSMGGSLGKVSGLERGQAAQEEAKKSNANASAVYQNIISASQFTAPAAGTQTIHVKDASGFSVSDTVYVAAIDQQEIQTTISSISNNRVVLADNVPKKYRETDFARLYKVL